MKDSFESGIHHFVRRYDMFEPEFYSGRIGGYRVSVKKLEQNFIEIIFFSYNETVSIKTTRLELDRTLYNYFETI